MSKEKLFITGINGRIGKLLREGLAEEYDIWGLDIAGPFSKRVFKTNIENEGRLRKTLKRAAPFLYLIHLAAVIDY